MQADFLVQTQQLSNHQLISRHSYEWKFKKTFAISDTTLTTLNYKCDILYKSEDLQCWHPVSSVRAKTD